MTFPEDMGPLHRRVLEAIAGGRGAWVGLEALPGDAGVVSDLVAADWLAHWHDGTGPVVTFTPGAAAYFGLTLAGEPSRWMSHAEAASFEPPKPRRRKRVACETDLMAARRDDGPGLLDTFPDGWRKPSDGDLAEPLVVLLGSANPWHGQAGLGEMPAKVGRRARRLKAKASAGARPCEACGDRPLKRGECCGRCTRHWQDKPAKPSSEGRRAS